MKNKYFTPDITDIHVGYELEIRQGNMWKSDKVQSNDCFCDFVDMDGYRVPYLTKEQIEAEGWTKEKSYFIKNNIYLFFEDKFLVIDSGNPFSWEAIDSEILFKGKCKDINTFRKICKLLEI